MGQTWFTSDNHLGHAFMAQFRGFDTVEEHDAAVIRAYRKVVSERDDVFFLGDVALGGRGDGLAKIAALPGRNHLILGNHDRAHPMNGNSHAHQAEYLRAFTSVQTFGMVRYRGLEILLSHFPYSGEGSTRAEDEDRATQWRLRDEGLPLVHGHVHDDVRVRTSAQGSVMMHAGLDAWGLRPVTLPELLDEAGLR